MPAGFEQLRAFKDALVQIFGKAGSILDKQQELPGLDHQIELPFPTMDIKSQSYKVFGMVTNMDWEGEKLIHYKSSSMSQKQI